MNIGRKIIHKILSNQTQQYIKMTIAKEDSFQLYFHSQKSVYVCMKTSVCLSIIYLPPGTNKQVQPDCKVQGQFV